MSLQLGLRLGMLGFVVPFVVGACSQASGPAGDAGMAGMSYRSSLSGSSGMSGVSSMGDMSGHIASVTAAQCDRMRQQMQEGQGSPDMEKQMMRCDRPQRGADHPVGGDSRPPLAR